MFRKMGIVDQWLLEALLLVASGFAAVSSCVSGVRALTEPRLTVHGLTLATEPPADASSKGKFLVEPIDQSVLSVFDPTSAERALASSGWLLLGGSPQSLAGCSGGSSPACAAAIPSTPTTYGA